MNTVEVVVAVIGRAHGVRGELTLILRTDEPDRRISAGTHLKDAESARIFVVRSTRWIGGRLQATFDGIPDRNAAEALRGVVLMADVPADQMPEGPDEFYDRQLIGLGVHDAKGEHIGEIKDVLHLPAQDVLSVRTAAGEKLIPFVSQLVPSVDLAAGVVVLADVPGLIDEQVIEDGSNGGASQ